MTKLLILARDGNRREIELTGKNLRLGRAPDADVPLLDDDKGVSRMHAEIRYENGRYTIVDLNSQNGTWVNGQRIQQADLTPGAEVTIGPFRLKLVGDVAAAPAAPTVAAAPAVQPKSAQPQAPAAQSTSSTTTRAGAPPREEPKLATPTPALAAEPKTAPASAAPTKEAKYTAPPPAPASEEPKYSVPAPPPPPDPPVAARPPQAPEPEQWAPKPSPLSPDPEEWAPKRSPLSPSPDDPMPPRPPLAASPGDPTMPARPPLAALPDEPKYTQPAAPPPPQPGPRPRPVVPYEEPTYKAPAAFSSSVRPSAEPSAQRVAPRSGERRMAPPPPPAVESTRTGPSKTVIIGGFVAITLLLIVLVSRMVKPGAPVNNDPPVPTAAQTLEATSEIIERHLSEGKALLQKKQYEAAIRNHFDSILLLDPNHTEATELKMKAQEALQQLSQDRALAAVAPPPPRTEPSRGNADSPASPRRPDESVDEWRARNTKLRSQYNVAKNAFDRRQYTTAMREFEALAKDEPDYLDAPQLLAKARDEVRTAGRTAMDAGNRASNSGNWVQALEQYDRARQTDPSLARRVEDESKKVREKMRNAGAEAFKRAKQHDEAGRRPAAIKEYENAAAWLPADDPNRATARQRAGQLKTGSK